MTVPRGGTVAITEPPFSTRRTVYGFVDRQNLDGLYRTFDFATPDATNPRRFTTTVPQQALFFLNSPFLHEQARKLSATIERESAGGTSDPALCVRRLYRRVLGRLPEPGELALATEFLRLERAEAGSGPSAWNGIARAVAGGPTAEASLSAWEQLAQVLLLTNEFMFVE